METVFFVGHYHDGIEILVKKFYAYLADDKIHWDYVENIDTAQPPHNPWEGQLKKQKDDYRVWYFWNNIPEKNRAWLEIIRLIPYDKIIEIDPNGDIYVQDPHIYVPFDEINGPFQEGYYATLRTIGYFSQPIYNPEIKNRIRFFPKKFPKPKEKKEENKKKMVIDKKDKSNK